MASSNVSVLETLNADLQSAFDHCVSSGLPTELLAQTGHTSIELSGSMLGFKTSYSVFVNHIDVLDDGYVVKLSISCVRAADGTAMPYGHGKTALKQSAENPGGKPQWYSLACKVFLPEVPAGQERLFEDAVEYHLDADAEEPEVPINVRREEHPVWLTGCLRFRLAAGGKYGLYINEVDIEGAVWNGKGSGSAPIASTTLAHTKVVDVTQFMGNAAAASPAQGQAIGTRRSRRTAKKQ